jgi:hypothetical protein
MAIAKKRRSTRPDEIELDCDETVQENDFVYIDANDNVVKKALSNSLLTMPAIGKVIKKKEASKCIIVRFDVEDIDVGDEVISPNQPYFISDTDAGKLRVGPPTDPDTVMQMVARGILNNKRLVSVQDNNLVIRS